jgi:hypothetical protein
LFQLKGPITRSQGFQHGWLSLQQRIVDLPKASEVLLSAIARTAIIANVKCKYIAGEAVAVEILP